MGKAPEKSQRDTFLLASREALDAIAKLAVLFAGNCAGKRTALTVIATILAILVDQEIDIGRINIE